MRFPPTLKIEAYFSQYTIKHVTKDTFYSLTNIRYLLSNVYLKSKPETTFQNNAKGPPTPISGIQFENHDA